MLELFGSNIYSYKPRLSRYFQPEKVVLTRGWDDTASQKVLAESIISVCSDAEVVDQSDRAHNRVDVGGAGGLDAHYRGKKTLVLGAHKSAVRFSEEADNTCPNYWHFSCYGFCPFDCKYCYLAGTPGVKFSPTVKIFLNIDQILSQVDGIAVKLQKPTSFYLGKLQDGLALDPLTGYCRQIIPFFAQHRYARQIILTKSDEVDNLLDLEHGGNTILSWSLNPPEVSDAFEANVPSIADRLNAIKRCAEVGYPIRAVIMPIIPIENWQRIYSALVEDLLQAVPLERITLGQICSFPSAMQLTEKKLGKCNPISEQLERGKSLDGRARFPADLRIMVYKYIVDVIKAIKPDMPIGLCLEEENVFDQLGMQSVIGCCNCVL